MNASTFKAFALGFVVLAVVVAAFIVFGGGEEEAAPDSGADGPQQGDALQDLGAPGGGSTSMETTAVEEEPLEGEPVADSGGESPEPDYAELSATQKQRVEGAVSDYVVSAYGYTGSDPTGYGRAVEQNVVLPDFYNSEGGEHIREQIERLKGSEVRAAAALDRFEIEEAGEQQVVGTAYYSRGESYDESGTGVAGGGERYSERITLVPVQSIYKISEASGPREVER